MGGAAFLVMTQGPAGLAAQEEEDVIRYPDIQGIAQRKGNGAQLPAGMMAVLSSPLRGHTGAELVAYRGIAIVVELQPGAETCRVGRVPGAYGVQGIHPPGGLPVVRGEGSARRLGQVIRGSAGAAAEGGQVYECLFHSSSLYTMPLAKQARG